MVSVRGTFICFLTALAMAQVDEAVQDVAVATPNDAAVVRAILDQNGMSATRIEDVAVLDRSRVISLNLNNTDFGKQGITMVPAEIGTLTELADLSMNDNDLVQLPDEIGNLKKLEKLEIRNNALVAIPSTIGGLESLRELDLRNNELTSLPIEIGMLGRLWKLQLWGNSLRSLPQTIGALSSLRELYLRGNRLSTFPMSVMKLKLKYIDIQDNRICSPEKAIDNWLKKFDEKYRSWQRCW